MEAKNTASLKQAVDITDWQKYEEFAPYPVGARDKTLVYCLDSPYPFLIPKHPYLFKRSNSRCPEQFWMEIIAYQLGCQMDIPVPPAFASFDRNEGQSGALIEWFIEPSGTQEYVGGGDYCRQYIASFDRKKGKQHNFETVIQIFQGLQDKFPLFKENWKEYWAKAFVFDALIGNADRHQENWGVIFTYTEERKALKEVCIAPVFDNGTSMGYSIESSDFDGYEGAKLEAYFRRGRHHMKWSLKDAKKTGHEEMLKRLSKTYPETQKIMLDCLKKVNFIDLEDILTKLTQLEVPVSLSRERAHFVLRIIKFRCDHLIKDLEI